MSLHRSRLVVTALPSQRTVIALLLIALALLSMQPARADDGVRPLAGRYAQPAPTRALDVEPPAIDGYGYEHYFAPRRTREWASLGIAAGFAAAGVALFASGDSCAIELGGDIAQFPALVAALAVPLARRDRRGVIQLASSSLTTVGVTLGLKAVIPKRRPDFKGRDSYPSGHAATAFAGASFLHSKYGPTYGVPAYVLALYTAFSRVHADRHYLDDTIAGAGIAMISNWLWAGRRAWAFDPRMGRTARPSWRLEFAFGAVRRRENAFQAPRDDGTAFDFANVDGTDDLLATARVSLHWFPTARTELMLRVDPNEQRGVTVLDADVRFGDATFPLGTEVVAKWIGTEYKLRGRCEILPCPGRWSLRPGLTVILVDQLVELEGGDSRERVGAFRAIPAPHLHVSWEFLPGLFAMVSADGIPGVDAFGFDVDAALRWEIAPTWDLGLLLRRSRRPFGADIDRDPVVEGIYLVVGRSF